MIDLEAYQDVISQVAERYHVRSAIHNEDFIFRFLVENPSFKSIDDAINYYFMDAEKSARKLAWYLEDVCKLTEPGIKLLEFASGYGCVTRHLGKILKNVEVTSCDIHEQAVEFITNKLGSPAILSKSIPEKFITQEQYDVIFALSFFSHMPKSTWNKWLSALANNVKQNGFLIFTTQGLDSMRFFGKPELDEEGFWFKSESEQKDLDTNEYGQTIVAPEYVFNAIDNNNELELILFCKAGWWGHQDLYIVKKSSNISRRFNSIKEAISRKLFKK